MTAIRFDRRGDITAITFVYDPEVVEIIKTIPSFARSWNPTHREWSIFQDAYATVLASMLHDAGHIVIGIEPARCNTDPDPASWAHAVFARVGPARAPLAYRLLSKLCHPDHGGDHQLQLELNQAYAELPDRKTAE